MLSFFKLEKVCCGRIKIQIKAKEKVRTRFRLNYVHAERIQIRTTALWTKIIDFIFRH